jgi:hypothetical protein
MFKPSEFGGEVKEIPTKLYLYHLHCLISTTRLHITGQLLLEPSHYDLFWHTIHVKIT